MKQFILLAAVLALFGTTHAQTTTWQIDPVHSSIAFSVDYMVLTEVTGRFNEFSGTLQQEGEDFTRSSVNLDIKAASITTENEKRDGHLRSPDFFDVRKFPEIVFTSRSFETDASNNYKIAGDLTMHGITKRIVIAARYAGKAKDPWGNTRQGFKGTATLDRNDFGVKYNSALETGGVLIGKDVSIVLNIQLVKQQTSGTN
jgi:polyisoprenoid-binding protein YceI